MEDIVAALMYVNKRKIITGKQFGDICDKLDNIPNKNFN